MIILLQILKLITCPNHQGKIYRMLKSKHCYNVKSFIDREYNIELTPLQYARLKSLTNRPESIDAAFSLLSLENES